MANKVIYEKWLRVNIQLNNAIEELKVLDAERENIGKNLQTADPQKLMDAMQESSKKYDALIVKVRGLKEQSSRLLAKIEG